MTSKLTRERLEKIKSWRETYGAGSNVMLPAEEAEELACLALAALNGEPVTWGNGCDKTVPAALRFLAENKRPFGGESRFNAAHLYQLAREIELMAEAPLYRHAQPAPVVPVVPDFKKLARELVDNLVDCGGLDEGVKEKYLEWAEKTCRTTMLVSAPQEAQVVPEKIEQSRKRVDRCDVCTEGARGGCGTCIFNGNFE